MTRFGMGAEDFQKLAQYMYDVIVNGKDVKQEIVQFRKQFLDLQYCFSGDQFEDRLQGLIKSI